VSDPTTPTAPKSWAPIALGLSALILVPLVIALVVLGAKFRGLGINLAMEHAEIARRVSAGEGLTTGSLRPISLALHPDLQKHPDLYHAPAHPLLLGLVFAILHPSDRVAATLGLLLWMTSVLLTFWLARRWFGPKVAALAAAFAACNVAMLKASVLGMPYPLCAVLVLLYAAVAAPSPRDEEPPGEAGSDARMVGAGLIAALAAMTHYLFFFFAPIVGLQAASSRRRRGRAAFLFLVGFVVLLLPWIIRNLRWARSPFFSFYWYEALAGTDEYPGDAVWRSMAAAGTGPWEFVFLHPLQMVRKISTGMIRLWQESLSFTDPVIAFLFIASIARGRGTAAWKGWVAAATGGMVLSTLVSTVFRSEPELWLAWTPLLAIFAAEQLAAWLVDRVDQVSLRRYWSFRLLPSLFQEPPALRAALRRSAAVAVLAIIGFPLFHYLWIFRAEPASAIADPTALTQSIPPQATVMTDQPALVAWRGQRRAVWLCLEEKEWDQIESRGGPITATYVTPSLGATLPNAKTGWWWWISSPRGIYRDLAPVESRLPGVLRLRKG
jgi:4-amino-4-deoxy-L-arabinose transferase-like glycosyltransferase